MDVHIRRLREKLEPDPASPEHILTKLSLEANTIFSTIRRGYVFITMRMAATTSR